LGNDHGGRSKQGGRHFFKPRRLQAACGTFPCCHILELMSEMRWTMMAGPGEGDDGLDEIETGVATRTRPKTKKPSNYKVLMLNDDYTPMEFVVLVLQRFFSMGIEDATRVMLQVHQQGVAVCGVFTYEVAETKVTQVVDFARENQHPLQCTLEKA
jgi:ATP-dependent Clp protease adaptor protein ClpS